MQFRALDNYAISLINYYRNSIWINILMVLISGGFGILLTYHNNGLSIAIAIAIAMIFIFYRIAIIRFIEQGKLLNHFVYEINIEQDKISLVTLGFSAFMGMMKKQPLSRDFKYEGARLKKANDKYGNNKRNGTVYLLIYKGEEFAIAEKFFNDFEELIAKLGENINRGRDTPL
jgi:hypothetical protein